MANVKPGDKIRIVNPIMNAGKYGKGDVLTVKQHRPEHPPFKEYVRTEEVDFNILAEEFEVIKPKFQFSEGDKVRVVKEIYGHGLDNGEVVRIDDVDHEDPDMPYVVVHTDGTEVDAPWLSDEEVEAYVEADVTQPMETVVRDAKIGDKIVITNKAQAEYRYLDGDVFDVNDTFGDDVVVETDDDSRTLVLREEYEVIEDLTKPNDVKPGDNIRITNTQLSAGKYGVGDVLTVESVRSTGSVYVKIDGDTALVFRSEFEITNDKPKETKEKIEVGDVVQVLDDDGSVHNEGEIGIVVSLGRSRPEVEIKGLEQYTNAKLVAKAADREDLRG